MTGKNGSRAVAAIVPAVVLLGAGLVLLAAGQETILSPARKASSLAIISLKIN